MITVIKLGGNCIDDELQLDKFLSQLAHLPGKKILVHGGGKLATSLSSKLGIPSQLIDGRRVTDAETLQVITMVYAGWINKTIVAKLQAMNCNATGFCGADGNLIQSEKRSPLPVDYGFVGDPLAHGVHVELLLTLLNENFVPVIAPVTHDGNGQLLNTNADTMAAVLAAAICKKEKVQLLYCFEKNGVLENVADEKSFFAALNPEQTAQLKADGKIHSGMLPKLKAGFSAKQNGVARVAIGNAMMLNKLATDNSTCTILQ